MKVIFVIQGEGRGHLTQALALKQMLLHEGHEVVKVLVGKSKNRVIPEFFQDKIGNPIEVFDSPNFLPSKDNRKFNLLRSLTYNTLLASQLSFKYPFDTKEYSGEWSRHHHQFLRGVVRHYLFPFPMDAEKEMAGIVSEDFDIDKLKAFARDYEEDVEFRMWENHAESRIVAAIENAYDTYYYRKENQAYEEENDSIVAASSLVVPARRVWQG